MMRKIRTSALIFMMLALLMAPLSIGTLIAGASEAEGEAVFTSEGGVEYIGEVDQDGNLIDVEPIDVPELEGSGIMAISAELDPDDALAPQARVGGNVVPFDTLIYKVMQTHNQWIVIIGGTLHADVPLPATIEVAVPAGSPVFWFGEVRGTGDPTQDPRFPGDLSEMRRTEGEFDIYTAVMTNYRDMQIEYRLNHNPFSQGPDGPTIALEYTPWQDVRELRLSAALPPGGAVLARDIEFMGFGPADPENPEAPRSPAFARVFTDVQGGQLYSTEITYTITGGGSAASNLSDVVVFGLAAVFVAAAGVMFVIFARGMNKNRNAEEDYYYEDEDGDDNADAEEADDVVEEDTDAELDQEVEDSDAAADETSFIKRH